MEWLSWQTQRIEIKLTHITFVYIVQGWATRQLQEPHLRQQSATAMHSMLKFIKSKHCSVLTDKRLTEPVRTAITTYQHNFKKLQLIQHYVTQIKYFIHKTLTLLKISCASHTSDVHELHCSHPCHTATVCSVEVYEKYVDFIHYIMKY
jgi:hypothetical protein